MPSFENLKRTDEEVYDAIQKDSNLVLMLHGGLDKRLQEQ